MNKVIITAPSLDPKQNVSGVSSVAQFIIGNNKACQYIHFQIGKTDKETGKWNRVKRIWRTYKDWKKILCEYPDSLIHYSFPLSTPSILRDPVFMWYARRHHRKMIVHVHGGLYLTAPKIPFLQRQLLKRVFSWNVPFIVLSEGEKNILERRWCASRVEVLPNCPDIPKEIADTHRFDKSVMTLGYLGRIEINKGMQEMLEACRILKADGVPFKLIIAGKEEHEGEYIPLFDNVLNDNICNCFEYVGLVSGESKKKFLSSLDVLVMPTYFEGLPMSLLECMSYGVVPVITNVGSISTVVKDRENGLFINVKNVDSIVTAVNYLNDHRDLLHEWSTNARKTISDNFSSKKYINKLNIIYQSL